MKMLPKTSGAAARALFGPEPSAKEWDAGGCAGAGVGGQMDSDVGIINGSGSTSRSLPDRYDNALSADP